MFPRRSSGLHPVRRLWAYLNEPDTDGVYAARGDDSDVDVREDASGAIVCIDCCLTQVNGHYATWTEDEMAEHLRDHKLAGHRVPATAVPRLLRR